MTFLSPPNEVTRSCRGKPNHTTTRCEFKRQWRHRELFLCSAQGWLTGSSSQTSRTRAVLIPRCCYLSTHHHFRTPGCLNMKNNPLVFLLHILALPSASHLAFYQPLLTMLLQPLAPSQTEIFGFDPAENPDPQWGWAAVGKPRKTMYIYIFFSPTVQTGVCKTAQFMPWEPFHQPSHQHQAKPSLPGERKSSRWVKKGSGCP